MTHLLTFSKSHEFSVFLRVMKSIHFMNRIEPAESNGSAGRASDMYFAAYSIQTSSSTNACTYAS